MATDIAFALGVLTLLGNRIPLGLKVFLTALAILDDIGAILVIALFYARGFHLAALLPAGLCLTVLVVLNAYEVRRLAPYLLLGALLWWFLLHSGIHATLAGVALALCLPRASARQCTRRLHPWVNFGILPLFALVNAGVALSAGTQGMLHPPLGLGILAGLCLGKPLGILLFSWLAVRLGIGALPGGVHWKHMLGAGILGGIGFTMSLFIADLGFPGSPLLDTAKLAVLGASLLSGAAGFLYLRMLGGNIRISRSKAT